MTRYIVHNGTCRPMTTLEHCEEVLPNPFKRSHAVRIIALLGYRYPRAEWPRWRDQALAAGAIVRAGVGYRFT